MGKNFSYQNVAEALYIDHIENKLDIGDVLPTEQELIDFYKVSRTTIRRGIKKLVKENFVYTIQGSGTFVKGKKQNTHCTKGTSFSERAKSIGAIPKTEVLEFQIKGASKEIAEKLKVRKGTFVYHYKRLRYLNDVPNQVEEGFLPVELFTDLSIDILSGSKYYYIEQMKKKIVKKNILIIEPILLDPDTAKLLKIQPNIPVNCIKATGFLDDDTVFEYTEIISDSNKFDLRFDIIRQSNNS